MELVGGLFLSLLGGGSTAATVAVPGIAGASTLVPAAAGGLGSLSGIASTIGVLSTIGTGVAGLAAGQAEAAQQQFASRDEYISGKETTAALKNELAKTIADQSVAFAAGGVDLGSVSVQEAKRQATADAEREIGIASNDALARSMARQRAARNARRRGMMNLFGSVLNAGGQIAELAA